MFGWIKEKIMGRFRRRKKEEVPIESELVNEVTPLIPPEEDIHHPSMKVKVFRFLNASALIADLVSLYFIYAAAESTINTCFAEFGGQSGSSSEELGWEEAPKMVLSAIVMLCCVANVTTNFCTINPVEDADVLARTPKRQTEDSRTKCEKNLSKTLCLSNQIIANMSYVVGSAGQMLSLTYFIPNEWANMGVGTPLTALGALYYHLLTHAKVTAHANVFIHKLLQKESMLLNTMRFPLRSFEVILQSISNAAYRGISFGFIMDQLLLRLFKTEDNTPWSVSLIAATTLLTFYVTIFSRTLNVHGQYLNPAFATIPAKALAETKISKLGFASDMLITSLRSGATGFLLYKCVPLDSAYRIILGAGSGVLLTAHGIYVRYKSRVEQTALDKIASDMKHNRSLDVDTIDINALSKEEIFNKLRDSKEAPLAQIFVTTLNSSARLGRSLSFIGFLIGLNEVLKSNNIPNLDFPSLLSLFGIWGITTLQNEWSFYESSMLNTVKYHTTKFALEAKNPYYGKWCSFFYSLDEYPKKYLQDHLLEYEADQQSKDATAASSSNAV